MNVLEPVLWGYRDSCPAAPAKPVQFEAVPLEREAVGVRLFLDARVEFQVAEFRKRTACTADQVVVVAAFGKLIPDASVFERHAAHHVQFLEQLDGPKYRRTAHRRDFREEVFHGERRAYRFDGLEDGAPGRGRSEPDGLQPCGRGICEGHVSMLANTRPAT